MKPVTMDPFLDRMERAMNVMSRRQQLTAANLANIDTPGYRTEDIDFKTALENAVEQQPEGKLAMRRTDPAHAASASERQQAAAHHVEGLAMRNDGNDVNIDREMLGMSKSRQLYDTTTSIARLRIKQLLSAIEDGRGA